MNTRLYFNRVGAHDGAAHAALNGTPGAQNSRFAANIGPTFSGFGHQPVVPQARRSRHCLRRPRRIRRAWPQRRLFWSVNSGAWNNAADDCRGRRTLYTGTIPGQVAGAVVQFYVQATDGLGAAATFPARGPDSGALYTVEDGQADLLWRTTSASSSRPPTSTCSTAPPRGQSDQRDEQRPAALHGHL